jgi:hypothetical protein
MNLNYLELINQNYHHSLSIKTKDFLKKLLINKSKSQIHQRNFKLISKQ